MRRLAPTGPLKQGEKVPSGLPTSPDALLEPASNGRSKNARAAHACEPCRSLKVRCLSNTDPSIQKCQRCARLNQECLIKPRGPRKPRKRTDTRVGELERKVEALRAALSESSVPSTSAWSTAESNRTSSSTDNQEHALVVDERAVVNISPASSPSGFQIPWSPCGLGHGTFLGYDGLSAARPSSAAIPLLVATKLFNKFTSEVMPHFPLDLFVEELAAGEDAATIREKMPTLFLAAITAAAGDYDLELHSRLNDQLAEDFTNRVVVRGEKSVELVQALICAAAYYHPPDAFEKLKYYQYIHMAWAMVMDLQLGSSDGESRPGQPHESLHLQGKDEMKRNTARRALTASYMSCLSVSKSMRRASMIHSEGGAERCMEALQKSSYATPRDHQLIAWAKLEIIMKDVARLLGLSDQDTPADVTDIRAQCTVKALEDRLERWKRELSPADMQPALEIMYHYSKIYLHEIVFHTADNVEDFRPPFRLTAPSKTSYNFPTLQTARLDGVIISMASAHSLIDVFLQLPPKTLCVIPTLLYIRASYAIFILLRIFFIASTPGSELGRVLDPTSVKIPYYLNRLISHTQAATIGSNCRLTIRFGGIFSRSRDWFRKHALRTDWENGGGGGGGDDDGLLEPFRLLSMNDEVEFQRCPVEPEMPDLHRQHATQIHNLQLDTIDSIDKDSTNRNYGSLAPELDTLRPSILASGSEIWQYPPTWDTSNVAPGIVQADPAMLEAQFGPLAGGELAEIPLGQVDDTMDDPFDLALGFDFDSHFWDFDMDNANFEPT